MSTLYSVGLMNQLGDALEAAGYAPGDVTDLRSKIEALKQLKGVLNGTSEIIEVKHIIDLNADPFVPDNWKVEEHIKGGLLEWHPSKVAFYLSAQQKGGSIKGNKLRKELKGKPVFNACLLDYLLAHPQLIPESWKGKYICFWGTVYRDSDGNLFVRCLYWFGGHWCWSYYWLDDDFDDYRPALLASGE